MYLKIYTCIYKNIYTRTYTRTGVRVGVVNDAEFVHEIVSLSVENAKKIVQKKRFVPIWGLRGDQHLVRKYTCKYIFRYRVWPTNHSCRHAYAKHVYHKKKITKPIECLYHTYTRAHPRVHVSISVTYT